MNPLRILVINWQDIRNPLSGGAEVHFHEIFSRVAAMGHSVTLLCSAFAGAAAEEQVDNIRVVRCGLRNLFNFVVPAAYRRLRRAEAFDVVIDDLNKIPFYTPCFVREPLLTIVHHLFGRSIYLETSWLPASYVYWSERLAVRIYRRTPFAVVSESTREELRSLGITAPNDWELQLLTSGGRRQFDTNAIIDRYDTRIAMSVMGDFILLGHQQVGSFALSSDKTHLFSVALGAYLDIICEVFNAQGIPRLIGMNAEHFRGITDYPELKHGDVESPDLKDLATYLRDLTGCGVIIPDEALEDYVRTVGGLPERLEATQFDQELRMTQRRENRLRRDEGQDIDTEDIKPEDNKGE